MKAFMFFTLFLLMVLLASADLSDYPSNFVDAALIVGDQAPALDVVSMTSLALSLGSEFGKSFENGLASEFSDPFQKTIISLGSPCANYINKELLDNEKCDLNFKEGFAVIQIFENNGEKQIVIAGSTPEDTRRAANVLVNYENYNLNKNKICIFGEKADDGIIINCAVAEKPITETTDYEDDIPVPELLDDEPDSDESDIDEQDNAPIPEVYDGSDDTVADSDDNAEQIKTTVVVKDKNFIQKFVDWFKGLFGL